MHLRSIARSAQQPLLYLLTALSFAFAIYFYLVLGYWPSHFPQDLPYRLANTQSVWFLIPAIPILLAAALLSIRNQVFGGWLSLAACFVAMGFSLSQVCSSAFLAFIPLLLPGGFFAIGLPTGLALIAIGYSLHVVRAKQNALSPVQLLAARTVASYIAIGLLALFAATTLLYVVVELALRGDKLVTYEMTWADTSNSRCDTEVTLNFAESPGYNITTCSENIATYLSGHPAELLEVQFQQEYRWGAWHYRLDRIAEWEGTAPFSGLSLYCDSSKSDCSRSPGRIPFRQPYILH